MKLLCPGLSTVILCMVFGNLFAQQVVYTKQAGAFPLVTGGGPAAIYYDTADATVAGIAARLFSNDVYLVSGTTPVVDSSYRLKSYSVIVGTVGKSKLIDRLIKSGKLKVSGIVGKWESYVFAVIDNPVASCKQALVIAGS